MKLSTATGTTTHFDAPYPGLRPFRFDESSLFYGRGKHIAAMLKILRTQQFLAVVGSSGSGKSSLVRAGLLPALAEGYLGGREHSWRFVDLRPGNSPFENLAMALTEATGSGDAADPDVAQRRFATLKAGPGGLIEAVDDSLLPENVRLLVLVDQFEELFRFAARETQRNDESPDGEEPLNEAVAFVDQLLWTVNARDPRVYVALTMRSDFLGDCDAFQHLPQAITRCQFLMPQLTRGELADAIERPLAKLGKIDSAVTSRLLNAIGMPQEQHPTPGNIPDADGEGVPLNVSTLAVAKQTTGHGRGRDVLPLLQHAMLRMWTLAEQDATEQPPRIKLQQYEKCGGFERALSQHASEVYDSLSSAPEDERGVCRQWIAQRMFCSLCQLGGEGRRVRRLATIGQIAAEAGDRPEELVNEVVDVAQQFLAPGVHFLMATPPGKLTAETTLDISHESLIRQWTLLQGWLAEEEASAALYTRLVSSARLYAAGHAEPLSEKELAHVEEWLAKRRPNAVWADRYVANTYLSLVMPLIDVSRSEAIRKVNERLQQERLEAERQQHELEQARQFAEVQQAKAAQFKNLAISIAIVLVAAVGLAIVALFLRSKANDAESRANRELSNVEYTLGVAARDWHGDPIKAGHRFLRAAEVARLADSHGLSTSMLLAARPVCGRIDHTFVHDAAVTGAVFSSDGSRLLTWSEDTTARLWEVTRGEPLRAFMHQGPVLGAIFSRDESRVLTWSDDNTARLWDVTEDKPPLAFTHQGSVLGATFCRDESRMLTWSDDNTARLWDLTQRKELHAFTHENRVLGAVFSPDATRVLTWSDDKTARLWELTRGKLLRSFQHRGPVRGAVFSPDATRVLTWSDDKTARLWDVARGEPLIAFVHNSWVIGALVSPDARRVLTWSSDNTAQLWEVTRDEPLRTFTHRGAVWGADLSRDESRVLTWSADNTARLWDVTQDEPLRVFAHHGQVLGAVISPNETHVLTWSEDNTARLWNLTRDEQLLDLTRAGLVLGAVSSLDEARMLTLSEDNTARLWELPRGDLLRVFPHEKKLLGATFSQDATRVLTWSEDNTARLWDVTQDKPLRSFPHQGAVRGAVFSPSATRVLTWRDDNMARLWDATRDVLLHSLPHQSWVQGAVFSRDESRLITWSENNTARLWELPRGDLLRVFRHEKTLLGATFSQDATRVLTWSEDSTARLWDVTQNKPLRSFLHQGPVRGTVFNQDATRVLTWSEDNTARLWNLKQVESLRVFTHQRSVLGAAFSWDEERVLTWSADSTARLWDVTQDEPLRTFTHQRPVLDAALDGDDTRVLTLSDDNTARLWDLTIDASSSIEQQRTEFEVRSGTIIDSAGRLRVLSYSEWDQRRIQLRNRQQPLPKTR